MATNKMYVSSSLSEEERENLEDRISLTDEATIRETTFGRDYGVNEPVRLKLYLRGRDFCTMDIRFTDMDVIGELMSEFDALNLRDLVGKELKAFYTGPFNGKRGKYHKLVAIAPK